MVSAERVQWFRIKAQMDRLVEEVEKLTAESYRVKNAFLRWKDVWGMLRLESPRTCAEYGHNAYVAKKIALYEKLSSNIVLPN